MKWVLIVGGVVAALGLFLLATASGDTAVLERQYPLLLGLNAALAALLAGLVVYQLVAMARRYRARVFGTRLTLRLLTPASSSMRPRSSSSPARSSPGSTSKWMRRSKGASTSPSRRSIR
jgi:hypothetical protein